MEIPSNVKLAITKAFDELQNTNDLKPITRLEIYDSFGSTFSPVDYFERIELLQQGVHRLTFADRIRSRLAIITAEKVVPIWRAGLNDAVETLIHAENSSVKYFWQKSVYSLPLSELADHVISVAKYILARGDVDIHFIFKEMCEVHQIFGRSIGCTEIECRAGWAAYEGLEQTLGLGPYNELPIDESTTDEDLSWGGAAGVEAMKSYSGILRDEYYLDTIDVYKRLEFWTWWLREAIPQAWNEESHNALMGVSNADLIPFRNTVYPTVRKIGKNLFTFYK